MVEFWIEGMRHARAQGKFVMFMPPDVIWSDGGFGHFADLIVHQGKRAIYINWHLRAISESFIPEFHKRYGVGSSAISASSRDLIRMTLDHIHPLSSIYLRDSEFFPRHSEMMFWPVPGEGVLMHVFALTPFIFDTSRFEYTDRKLVTKVEDPDDLHYVVDSDDLYIVSLAELGKDRDWYETARPFDFVRHAEWWLYYDSPGNDYLTPQPFRLKFSDATEAKWNRAEASARLTLRRAIAAREVYRIGNWQRNAAVISPVFFSLTSCVTTSRIEFWTASSHQPSCCRTTNISEPIFTPHRNTSPIRPILKIFDASCARIFCPDTASTSRK